MNPEMTTDPNQYATIDSLLCQALAQLGDRIPSVDRLNISEYLDHGEYGVAYELLVFVIDREHITWPESLGEAGAAMGLRTK
ncbi:hypothetical protein CNECB9_2710002 [Cupriavidus necator]|uniref:Uncharacterized protein n=1 Tax=Cupriavidus necator TaxID=106590 RepID=A0A1K0IGI0_CUPNE|nr:hypothetical protein CNECB9_2710002 [Cupriavidus necator]